MPDSYVDPTRLAYSHTLSVWAPPPPSAPSPKPPPPPWSPPPPPPPRSHGGHGPGLALGSDQLGAGVVGAGTRQHGQHGQHGRPRRHPAPNPAALAEPARTRRASSSARAIEALAEAEAGGGWRRQLSPPPRAVAKPKRPAHRRHRPAPIRLRSPGRPVWAARTEPGAPGSRALDAVGVCARHAWHWHGAAGAHCGAAGAMHRVNGRGVRQAHRSRRAVRAAPAPSTLLVAARRPPAGWLGHHLPAGQERALTWQVAAWISSEWAARGARCEGRRRTCSRVPAWAVCGAHNAAGSPAVGRGGTRWDAVGRWDARGVRFSRARGAEPSVTCASEMHKAGVGAGNGGVETGRHA